MKKLSLIFGAFLLIACQFGAYAATYYLYVPGSGETREALWTDSSIWYADTPTSSEPVGGGFYAGMSDLDKVDFFGTSATQSYSITLNTDVSIGGFVMDQVSPSVEIYMQGTLPDLSDATLTIDANGTSTSKSSPYNFITYRSKLGSETHRSLSFYGGTVHLTGLSQDGYGYIQVAFNDNAKGNPLSITFDSALLSDSNLILKGDIDPARLPESRNYTINLNGKTDIGVESGGVWTYKNLIVDDHSTIADKGLGLNVVVGKDGVVNASTFTTGNNTVTTINGTMRLHKGSTDTSFQSEVTPLLVETGSTLTVDGGTIELAGTPTASSNYDAYLKAGSVVTLENGGKIESGARIAGENSTFNIYEGSTISAAYTRFFLGMNVNLSGSINLSGNFKFDNSTADLQSLLTVSSGASISATNIEMLNYGSMLVESGVAEGAIQLSQNYVKLGGVGISATDRTVVNSITLNSANVFEGRSGSAVYISLSGLNGRAMLNVNADQKFEKFSFENTGQILFLNLGENLGILELDSLSGNSMIANGGSIVIDGFQNGLIHLASYESGEESFISSLNGDWEDFEFVKDTTGLGGYWLSATQIPEPALTSIISAICVLLMFVYKRKKS